MAGRRGFRLAPSGTNVVDRITAAELKALQDGDADFVLVDTRPREDHEAMHVRGARHVRYPPDEDEAPSDEEIEAALEDVERDRRIVLICAKGIAAAALVERLGDLGYENVQMVDDGMEGWSTVYDAVSLPVGGDLEVIQLQRRAKGCLSYVVGSESTGEAVAVDPTRHTDALRGAAERFGYDLTAVVDTHVHADHVSGGPDLAEAADVPYYLGEVAADRGVEHDHETLAANAVLEVGSVSVKAVHTPGHTEGMLTLLLEGEAALTADTLHVDSVGRVELAFEDEEDVADGARTLHRSLHRTLLALPEDTGVYPGHFTVTPAGEFEAATPGTPVGTTIGEARRDVDLLGLDAEAFVSRLTDDVPEEPPNYERIVAINRGVEELDEDEAESLELGPNNCGA